MAALDRQLVGNYYVTPTPAAIKDAHGLFPRYGDYQEARRHALKLVFWPLGDPGDGGQIMDLDWEWIKAVGRSKVGELRISNVIGGHNNLRVIFHVTDVLLANEPLPRIWIVSVLQKKARHFTARDIETFRGRLTILKRRYYGTHSMRG